MSDKTFRAWVVTEEEPKQFVRAIAKRSTADLPPGELLVTGSTRGVGSVAVVRLA